MTIEQIDKIDVLTITHAGEVLLTISDHLPWGDQDGHLLLLQEKLNTYLRFVESGELQRRYAEVVGRPVVLKIGAKFDHPEVVRVFLDRAKAAIAAAGFELRVEIVRPN